MTNDEEKQQELSETHTTVLKSKPGRTQHSKLPSMCASVVVQHISVDLRSGASDGVGSEFLKRAVLSDPFTVHDARWHVVQTRVSGGRRERWTIP
jgi:hypothetical protein